MKKNQIYQKSKTLFVALTLVLLIFSFGIGVYADESEVGGESGELSPEYTDQNEEKDQKIPKNSEEGGEKSQFEKNEEETASENLFEEIYAVAVENSDKIFSILAFLGTLVVGVGYKSGFLPLLRDALSKLKIAIDSAKEESGKNDLTTKEKIAEIGSAIDEIDLCVKKNHDEITRINWQFESYEEIIKEREAMRLILSSQIDLLYAIFMSSALPQYQKDEIGEKIQKMREELKSYEVAEN